MPGNGQMLPSSLLSESSLRADSDRVTTSTSPKVRNSRRNLHTNVNESSDEVESISSNSESDDADDEYGLLLGGNFLKTQGQLHSLTLKASKRKNSFFFSNVLIYSWSASTQNKHNT